MFFSLLTIFLSFFSNILTNGFYCK
jgi:hypothetical protein